MELEHDFMFIDRLKLQNYQEETLNSAEKEGENDQDDSAEKEGENDQDDSLFKDIFSNTIYLTAFACVFILGCICLCCYLNRKSHSGKDEALPDV